MNPDDFEPLTARELRVAVLYTDTDLSPRQIGARLGITALAVRLTAGQVYRKLHVRGRPHLRSVMLEFELAPVGAR